MNILEISKDMIQQMKKFNKIGMITLKDTKNIYKKKLNQKMKIRIIRIIKNKIILVMLELFIMKILVKQSSHLLKVKQKIN